MYTYIYMCVCVCVCVSARRRGLTELGHGTKLVRTLCYCLTRYGTSRRLLLTSDTC